MTDHSYDVHLRSSALTYIQETSAHDALAAAEQAAAGLDPGDYTGLVIDAKTGGRTFCSVEVTADSAKATAEQLDEHELEAAEATVRAGWMQEAYGE